MTDSDERSVSISRRQFLAGVGATSAGAAAIGSAATDDPTLALGSTEPMPINERFNIDDYRIGPKSERPAAADVKGTVYEVTDNNASNGTRRTFSDGAQWVTLNVEADVVDTGALDITGEFALHADYTIATYGGGYIAVNGNSGSVEFSGDKIAPVLQSAIDARNGRSSHFHFINARRNDPRTFVYESAVTWDLKSLLVTGGGKNKAQHSISNTNGNTDIWIFDNGTTSLDPIYEIQNQKFVGNTANNTSGSGIINKTANEINCFNCEFRSFPEYGFKFEPSGKMDYNYFDHCWFLDNDLSGLYIADTTSSVEELNLDGCTLVGDVPDSPSTGMPAVHATDGANPSHININGGTLKGADVLQFDSGQYISLSGVQSQGLYGTFAAQFGGATSTVAEIDVSGCQFAADSTSPVTNYLGFDDASQATVSNCNLRGSSGDPITWTASTSGLWARGNNGYRTEFNNQGTVTSGTTSVSIQHGLDVTPGAEDIFVSPHSSLGAASTWWHDSISANYVTINVDADPTVAVDFSVHSKKTRLDA